MDSIKSVRGNVIETDLQRIDPTALLNSECLNIFYETVKELGQLNKITTKEWNCLIIYIHKLNTHLEVKHSKSTGVM
ncbi:hypothetical protein [Brevibacillus brevis]|uniref:hypothetical protein n=1 Tax=Brevibacillus brevis TaxID=1393 RepID=UPI0007D8BFF3|nr:hypothetical protein [Brevibacillus brevis]